MARAIVTWCDVCLDDDQEVPGVELVAAIDGAPRLLDLCGEHRADLVEPLAKALDRLGRPAPAGASSALAAPAQRRGRVPRSKDDTGPYFCLVPGCTGYRRDTGFRSRDQVRGHVSKVHQLSLADYEAHYGYLEAGRRPSVDTEDLGSPVEVEVTENPCGYEDCPVTYPSNQFRRPRQSLGAHRWAAHGVTADDWAAYKAAHAAEAAHDEREEVARVG